MAMVEACMKAFGRIDILVNNVGGSAAGGPVELAEEVLDAQLDYNLKSVFLTCKHVLPIMEQQGGGAIVNLASTSGTALDRLGADRLRHLESRRDPVLARHRRAIRQEGHPGEHGDARPASYADGRGAPRQAAHRRRRREVARNRASSAFRWASWATAATPRTRRCSSRRTRRASSPGPRSSLTAECPYAATE